MYWPCVTTCGVVKDIYHSLDCPHAPDSCTRCEMPRASHRHKITCLYWSPVPCDTAEQCYTWGVHQCSYINDHKYYLRDLFDLGPLDWKGLGTGCDYLCWATPAWKPFTRLNFWPHEKIIALAKCPLSWSDAVEYVDPWSRNRSWYGMLILMKWHILHGIHMYMAALVEAIMRAQKRVRVRVRLAQLGSRNRPGRKSITLWPQWARHAWSRWARVPLFRR